MSALSDIVTKLTADVNAKLDGFATQLSAVQADLATANAKIVELQTSAADVPQAVADLTALDVKVLS